MLQISETERDALKFKAKQLRNEINPATNQPNSYRDIAEKLEIGIETARRYVKDINQRQKGTPVIETRPASQLIDEDYNTLKLKAQAQTNARKYNELLTRYTDLEKLNEAIIAIKDTPRTPIKIEPNKRITKSEAVAIALASDWHVGQNIRANTVNNLNEYNPDVCKRRATNYFKNLLKLIEKERQDVIIDKLVLWLGGDYISGLIHPELIEDNFMSPLEEVLFAQELLIGGIQFLLDHGKFKQITIPCSYGNHGRTEQHKKIATAYKNNFEWLMYRTLAQLFQNDPRVQFSVSDAYFNYLEIFGKTVRFHHGDFVKGGGGLGGITIPLNKFIYRSNEQIVADLDCLGHFHQFTRGTNFIINGSLSGFDNFALSIGASPERPQQAFQLLDSKFGFTISAPILVEEGTGKYD